MRVVFLVLLCLILQSCSTAAEQRQLDLGKKSFVNGDYKKAFHDLLPLASEGNAQAEYAIGYLYYYGYGVGQDAESGKFWMTKSAAQHYDPAVVALQMIK